MRIDTVERAPVPVIHAASSGDRESIPAAASRAFQRLEAAIPPSGRRLYGYWQPESPEYRACYAREATDAPVELGLSETVIPGGRYRRARIEGEDAFARIPAGFRALEQHGDVADDGRPWFELYRRHDKVDLLVPIASDEAGSAA